MVSQDMSKQMQTEDLEASCWTTINTQILQYQKNPARN